MTTESVVVTDTVVSGVARVVLNRPKRLNALSQPLVAELHAAFARADADPDTRVVILTGAGRGFCAGADIKGDDDGTAAGRPVQDGTVPSMLQGQEHIASLNDRIHRLRKPVIAAVNGVAVGGGFALALACDVRIAATTASFATVFPTLGLSGCDMGTSYFLPRLIGGARSAELLLTGRSVDAAEAQALGLVTDVVEPEDLEARALETARLMTAMTPLGAWMTKETMWQTIDSPSLRAALDIENRTQLMCAATGSVAAAMAAFQKEKR